MNVKKRGFTAKLIPENVLIGISRPLELRLLYADLDNSGLKPEVCPHYASSLVDDSNIKVHFALLSD